MSCTNLLTYGCGFTEDAAPSCTTSYATTRPYICDSTCMGCGSVCYNFQKSIPTTTCTRPVGGGWSRAADLSVAVSYATDGEAACRSTRSYGGTTGEVYTDFYVSCPERRFNLEKSWAYGGDTYQSAYPASWKCEAYTDTWACPASHFQEAGYAL